MTNVPVLKVASAESSPASGGENGARALTVAFLIDRWEEERGGAERALAALARHLQSRGHRVLAFARRASPSSPGEFHPVSAGGISRSRREIALARALVRAAEEQRADVTLGIRHLEQVDVFWPHAGAHAVGLAARDRARRSGANAAAPAAASAEAELDLDEEGATPGGRHGLFCELEAQLCQGGGARRVVCVSDLVARELAQLYPACVARLETVPNGIDLARFQWQDREARRTGFRSLHGIPSGAPVVAFVAHDAELKGLPTLLDALAGLRASGVHLLLAGARPIERWARRAARVVGEGRVHAFATVDACEALSAADVLAHPTWRDTSGLVILESLAVGTPVVTTAEAGEAPLVRESVGGTVLERPGDPVALERALVHWLERARAGDIDRAAVHACVEGRGLERWLSAMEAIVVAAARR